MTDARWICTSRTDMQRALPLVAALLNQRRAGDLCEHQIEAYVQLDWLEWRGGHLRLTMTGRNICDQFRVEVL